MSSAASVRFVLSCSHRGLVSTQVLTPAVPHLFLLLASVSNIGKNISWLASSATRAQMHNSFALRGNLGDITAKITSQSIAASLVGTALGILVSKVGSRSVGFTLPVIRCRFRVLIERG